MSRFDTQLKNRITVLRKIVQDGPARHRDIISDTSPRTGSEKISQTCLGWLVSEGYVRRVSRGMYEATKRGMRLDEHSPTGGSSG